MASVNKVILIGRVGKDPEFRATQGGREICNFSLATSEGWKDKNSGERKEKTEWHNVVIFNDNLLRIAKDYLKKGGLVYVEGALQTRKWQDKSGADRYSTEVVLQNFGGQLVMLTKDHEEKRQGTVEQIYESASKVPASTLTDDEIPFALLIGFAFSALSILLNAGSFYA